MANIPLKSIQFPGLDDTYTVPSNAGELAYNKSATYPADTVGKALQNIGDSSAPAIIETATGSIASFDDGADNVPVKDLIAEIVPLQSGSGDPSPDNVRAISGWTEANISVTGVNVWDEEWELGALSSLDGSNAPSTTTIRSKNYIRVVPNTTYYVKSPNGLYVYGYDADKNMVMDASGGSKKDTTFTTPSNCAYIRFWVHSNYGTTYNNDISINYPSTDHDYHAYNGSTHTISFASAGTVYGGRLDVTSGVLTVTGALITFDGTEDWRASSNPNRFYVDFQPSDFPVKFENHVVLNSNSYKYWDTASGSLYLPDKGFMLYYADGYWAREPIFHDSSFATVEEWKTHLSNNNIQVYYPLATPQTYQLTPTEVKTLLKNNNIWADTGDVTVEYVADTKTFIENLVNA